MRHLCQRLQRQIAVLLVTTALVMAWIRHAPAQTQARDTAGSTRLEPLPVDEAIAYAEPVVRARVNLSPDGQWLAFTSMRSDETLFRETYLYSASGVPFTDGNGRMRAFLTHTQTGEVIGLCTDSASSWAPMWSS